MLYISLLGLVANLTLECAYVRIRGVSTQARDLRSPPVACEHRQLDAVGDRGRVRVKRARYGNKD